MPYIICQNMPGCLPESDPVAVATIEEARQSVFSILEDTYGSASVAAVEETVRLTRSVGEGGAIIGPLPDGYIIDVQSVSWRELRRLASRAPGDSLGADARETRQNLLDAYNGER